MFGLAREGGFCSVELVTYRMSFIPSLEFNITIHDGKKNRLACMSQEQLALARAVAVKAYDVHWL
jgi:hypothetical protein